MAPCLKRSERAAHGQDGVGSILRAHGTEVSLPDLVRVTCGRGEKLRLRDPRKHGDRRRAEERDAGLANEIPILEP